MCGLKFVFSEETQEQREERIKQWQDFIANENDEHTTEAAPMHA